MGDTGSGTDLKEGAVWERLRVSCLQTSKWRCSVGRWLQESGGRIEILAGDGDVLVDSHESGGDHPESEYKEKASRHPALRNPREEEK